MTILNFDDNSKKKIPLGFTSPIYTTKGEVKDGTPKTELQGDLILLGTFTHNTIFKKILLSTDKAIAGMIASIVLLNKNNEEFSKIDAGGEVTIAPLVSDINFTNVITNSDKTVQELKFKTIGKKLEELIDIDTYQDEVKLALKITTAPTNPVSGAKILTEITFIEKY